MTDVADPEAEVRPDPAPEPTAAGPRHARAAFPRPWTRAARWAGRQIDDLAADPVRATQAAFSLIVVGVAVVYVMAAVHPSQVLKDTTATGGDMGSHVWGPDYLMHHLLPKGRLSGWTPDWYDGFPAYQFYMVVPSLFVVALTVGVKGVLVVPAVLAALAVALSGWWTERLYRFRKVLLALGLVLLVLVVPIPYNPAFKIVTVSGLVTLPVAAWAFGKLCDLPFPVPPLCSLAALLFIFNREPLYNGYGNIIGGNMTSTMAGEFAFSISITFSVLFLGVAVRGLKTGRHRGWAALLFALAGLCHLIPAFFVLTCTAILFLLHPSKARAWWLATVVPVGGLLTAFWVVPFYLRSDYVNDMGWEKLPVPVGVTTAAGATEALQRQTWYYLMPKHLWVFMAIALVGLVVSIVVGHRVGIVLGAAWAIVWVAFVHLPQARLWNARLLPFMYLSVFLLAAIAVGELARSLAVLTSRDPERPSRALGLVALPLAFVAVWTFVALPMASIDAQGGQSSTMGLVQRDADGYARLSFAHSRLGRFVGLDRIKMRDQNPVSSWADWNYKGLQEKQPTPAGCGSAGGTACTTGGWPEYREVMATMARLGQEDGHGCGRALWEYAKDRVDGYGTPMALMMLPYFTDGCIGSQEGLYFESSTTTPYHFIMQAELSTSGSNPQREIPYPSFDMTDGVEHLQMLGVRYYLAATAGAVSAADKNPDLTPVAQAGAWHVYQVSDAPVVEGLAYEPAVMSNVGEGQHEWLDPAVAWFRDPDRWDVPLAVAGPKAWQRVTFDRVDPDVSRIVGYARSQLGASNVVEKLPKVARRKLPKVDVSKVRLTDDGVSFDVDKVGVPVVVKVSYFPNWKAEGADGPYRITPNLMVVIPRATHVSMHFGRTPVDLLGSAMTVGGIGGLVALFVLPPVVVPEPRRWWAGRLWRQRTGRGDGPPSPDADDAAGPAATASTAADDADPDAAWRPADPPSPAGPPVAPAPGGPAHPPAPDAEAATPEPDTWWASSEAAPAAAADPLPSEPPSDRPSEG